MRHSVQIRRHSRWMIARALGARSYFPRVYVEQWPDGWVAQALFRDGGYIVADQLATRIDAIDAALDHLHENGGTGLFEIVSLR